MIEYLCEWIENVAFYLVIFTVISQIIPNNSYRKYIRFFTGLILIVMLMSPITQLFGMGKDFETYYNDAQYEQQLQEIERATKYLEEWDYEVE